MDTFVIEEVGMSPADRAARYALSSFYPGVSGGVEGVKDSTIDLMRNWRARTFKLREHGYVKTADRDRCHFHARCRPVGIKKYRDPRGTYVCRNSHACPFCWCRSNVYKTWDRLRWAARKPGQSKTGATRDNSMYQISINDGWLDLLEVITWRRYERSAESPLSAIFSEINKRRRELIDGIKPVGAFQLFSVEPSRQDEPAPNWLFTQRVLALVPRDDRTPAIVRDYPNSPNGVFEGSTGYHHYQHMGVSNISRVVPIVGLIAKYPYQLIRGPIAPTVEVLNFLSGYGAVHTIRGHKRRSGFRMSAYYGSMRNTSK